MYREYLLSMLEHYARAWPDETGTVERMREFVERHKNCFLRTCRPGHVTGSAWIVSPDQQRCLLMHHRKLEKWLQLGGHADGEPETHRVALREAVEESGMFGFELLHEDDPLIPLDIDIHRIPANNHDPEHLHYDVRFLLRGKVGEEPRANSEANEIRWFAHHELSQVTDEPSVTRMAQKARAVLAGRGFV